MIYISKPAQDVILATGLAPALNTHHIVIYSGDVPADADAGVGSATVLLKITTGGTADTALQFEAVSNGVISKKATDIWSGTVVAGGTPSFFRLCPIADTAGIATTEVRIQGTVGPTGDLILEKQNLTAGDVQVINIANITIPISLAG